MTKTLDPESDLDIAPAESAARNEFEWSAEADGETISIVRTSQSSPVWIQANN